MTPRRRIINDALYAHFLTFSGDRRRRLLDHDHTKRIVLGLLDVVLDRTSARCVGFVLMPDHVPAVIWFSVIGRLSHFAHEWKRLSSLDIRRWMRHETSASFEDFGEGSRLWQPKYYSFEISEQTKLQEKVAFMRLNPVRRGPAVRTTDWKWSSARWYESGRTVGVPREWVPE